MLINLFVKNFAIIKQINIDFRSGLNILSGETGSGKSLLLKSLSFLKGERFNKEYIGNFSDQTIIEATFSSNEMINSLLLENGFDIDENIILSRTFTQNSSISKINNRSCSIKFMGEVSSYLFDIHGQHSQLIILEKSNYIDIIDQFDHNIDTKKQKLDSNLKEINSLKLEKEKFELSDDEIEREKDLLNYQINEIEAFDFKNYDRDSLNSEYKKLTNQAELITTTNNILELINESNRSLSLKEMINKIDELLTDIKNIDEELNPLLTDLINIRELIYDFSDNMDSYLNSLDIDDERISIIEDIFSSFQVLKLKYGNDKEEILSYLKEIKKRYDDLINISDKIDSIDNQIKLLEKDLISTSKEITDLRKEIIKDLEIKIIKELQEMNMKNIQFKIDLTKKENISKNGQDDIDFLISTNKGQELKSLSTVSSGGEISRFMLALKAVFIDNEKIDTIVFDEIDTGISGITADIVGEKLRKISKKCQLLVISHLSQIASKGDHHYLLYKEINDDNTYTNIVSLDKKERIKEIARLISGTNITQKSIEAASELLKED